MTSRFASQNRLPTSPWWPIALMGPPQYPVWTFSSSRTTAQLIWPLRKAAFLTGLASASAGRTTGHGRCQRQLCPRRSPPLGADRDDPRVGHGPHRRGNVFLAPFAANGEVTKPGIGEDEHPDSIGEYKAKVIHRPQGLHSR